MSAFLNPFLPRARHSEDQLTSPAVCIQVVAADLESAERSLAQIHSQGYLAELRLDYLARPDLPQLLQFSPGARNCDEPAAR